MSRHVLSAKHTDLVIGVVDAAAEEDDDVGPQRGHHRAELGQRRHRSRPDLNHTRLPDAGSMRMTEGGPGGTNGGVFEDDAVVDVPDVAPGLRGARATCAWSPDRRYQYRS
eukprot:3285993-Rhodomonas_salina.1